MTNTVLNAALERAKDRRSSLAKDDANTNAYRWVNGEGDGVSGWTLDRFGDVAALSFYEAFAADEEQRIFDSVERVFAPKSLYVKRRPKEARVVANTKKDELAPALPERGVPVETVVARENGLRFLIRPGQGLSLGLYLDMREPRAWLMQQTSGKTVLNTFAYTCGFGVAAVAGGATRALNVDLSRRVLDWGAQNASLNDQPVNPRDYVAGDVFEWMRRFKKKGEAFDVVVVDPPSFSTARGKAFSAAAQYSSLVAGAAAVVSPGGLLLACCNLAQLSANAFESQVERGVTLGGRVAEHFQPLRISGEDFPFAEGKAPALKVTAVRIRG